MRRAQTLIPKRPRIHGYRMTNSIDQIVENGIRMGPNFMSSESVKKIADVGKKLNQIGLRSSHMTYSNQLKNKRSNLGFSVV